MRTKHQTTREYTAKQTVRGKHVPSALAEQSEALHGKEGALLWAVSAKNGKKLSEYKLDSLPAWDGMIATGGRLYLATATGEVVCYSGKGE